MTKTTGLDLGGKKKADIRTHFIHLALKTIKVRATFPDGGGSCSIRQFS